MFEDEKNRTDLTLESRKQRGKKVRTTSMAFGSRGTKQGMVLKSSWFFVRGSGGFRYENATTHAPISIRLPLITMSNPTLMQSDSSLVHLTDGGASNIEQMQPAE